MQSFTLLIYGIILPIFCFFIFHFCLLFPSPCRYCLVDHASHASHANRCNPLRQLVAQINQLTNEQSAILHGVGQTPKGITTPITPPSSRRRKDHEASQAAHEPHVVLLTHRRFAVSDHSVAKRSTAPDMRCTLQLLTFGHGVETRQGSLQPAACSLQPSHLMSSLYAGVCDPFPTISMCRLPDR